MNLTRIESQKAKLILIILAAVVGILSLSACSVVKEYDEDANEVVHHFSHMEKYEVNEYGRTLFSIKKPGVLYIMTELENLDKVNPQYCLVDGNKMEASPSTFNYPTNPNQNTFTVAELKINTAGKHELVCHQPNKVKLFAAIDTAR